MDFDPDFDRLGTAAAQGPRWRRFMRAAIVVGCVLCTAGLGADAPRLRGLLFSRSYSLEDIGYVPRGSRLSFDSFGRVAVIHDGVYAVLNDAAWLNLAESDEATRLPMTDVVQARDGRIYYGGRASWGLVEFSPTGKLHAKPLLPENRPAWTRTTTFEKLVVTDDGVFFMSRAGVAFWDMAKQQSQVFEMPKLAAVFAVGNRVFISSFDQPLRAIEGRSGRVRSCPGTILDQRVVVHATTLDESHALIAFLDGPVMVFDGEQVTPWHPESLANLTGQISALERLSDGNIAVALTGKGVFIVSPGGQLLQSLTIPQYHRVSSIASRERGVLWLLTEDSIEKVLYQGGLTSFGQRLGLPVSWPSVGTWNDRMFVASGVVLYEAGPSAPGEVAHFEPVKIQPPGGVWSFAASSRHLLVGSRSEVYALGRDGNWNRIAQVGELRRLVMVGEDSCYAIGQSEIALLDWNGEQWVEPAPRIPGLRNPAIAHRAGQSVWVEMAGDGVARISRKAGQLHTMVLPNEPWTKSLWVNIGVINDTVVLSPTREARKFFDEQTETWCARPELERLLARSPRWLNRVSTDDAGTIWATHSEGLVKFTPKDGDYEMDLVNFDLINDRYPLIQKLPGNEIWVTASRTLQHVEAAPLPPNPVSKPILVSLVDSSNNTELLRGRAPGDALLQLPYTQNNLTFQFFSGGYGWRRTPVYEFRFGRNDPWAPLDTGSRLRVPSLHEGKYDLQVRMGGDRTVPGAPMTFAFEILPPWYRTWPAYALYAALGVLAVAFAIQRSNHLSRRRNRELEQIVRDRTGELESTMEKLNEETRISATLAERDRLAGEIHDSVQQGLTGAILQLDTTLKLPRVAGDMRSRLNVVRNMVSYVREEVQNAVWDMDSPLLNDNNLGDAIRKVTTLSATGTVMPTVTVSGSPIQLPRATTHHLLRIAQEGTANAIRHAMARHISIELHYQPDAVSIRISDDGIGFDPDVAFNQSGHFGLRGIRGRAGKLQGELSIRSSRKGGTFLQIRVPLKIEQPISSHAEAHLS